MHRTDEEVDVSCEVGIHDHPLVGGHPDGDAAMILLGRLTYVLRNHQMTVDLMVGEKGVSGLLLKKHLCGAPTPRKLEDAVDALDQVARRIEADLGRSPEEREIVAFPSLIAGVAKFTPSKERAEPFVIPTFDSAQLAEMKARSEQLER